MGEGGPARVGELDDVAAAILGVATALEQRGILELVEKADEVSRVKAEGLTKKMVLPPGPRNPVGTDWIGLSLPGYGIHGTPEPENISRTQSHGCFRLANWNADKVLKMVKVGTPIDVQP